MGHRRIDRSEEEEKAGTGVRASSYGGTGYCWVVLAGIATVTVVVSQQANKEVRPFKRKRFL